MLIDIIAGAHPNFMKIAPIIEAIEKEKNNGKNIDYRLIHTGQHYAAFLLTLSPFYLKKPVVD